MVGEFAELGNEALDLLDHLRRPEVDELPMPTHSPGGARTLLRDLALFLAAAPMVLAALLGATGVCLYAIWWRPLARAERIEAAASAGALAVTEAAGN